jgi:hypothetical protein
MSTKHAATCAAFMSGAEDCANIAVVLPWLRTHLGWDYFLRSHLGWDYYRMAAVVLMLGIFAITLTWAWGGLNWVIGLGLGTTVLILELLRRARRRDEALEPHVAQPMGQQPTPLRPGSAAKEIELLADLHDRGALTDDEFRQAKANVLGPTDE